MKLLNLCCSFNILFNFYRGKKRFYINLCNVPLEIIKTSVVHKGHIVKYPVMYFMVPSKKKKRQLKEFMKQEQIR